MRQLESYTGYSFDDLRPCWGKINIRPQENRYVIGLTSLWLLIPGILGLEDFLSVRGSWISGAVTALCFTCCAISTLHWQHCVEHSMLHRADRKLAVIFFIVLIIFGGFTSRQLPSYVLISFPIVVLTFYAGAQYCVLCEWILGNLGCHLTFRFLGYWWAFLGSRTNRTKQWCTFRVHQHVGVFVAYSLHVAGFSFNSWIHLF